MNARRICSGTLISIKNVLTTAQCIFNIRKVLEMENCTDIGAYIDRKRYEIADWKPHPRYNSNMVSRYYNYDLGLIRVSLFIGFQMVIDT